MDQADASLHGWMIYTKWSKNPIKFSIFKWGKGIISKKHMDVIP